MTITDQIPIKGLNEVKNITIKRFDSNNLTQLAKDQTLIYNQAIQDLPDYFPAKVEDVITRFQRKEFDQKRMFYAYNGSKMIGYSGLTGRDQKENLRTVGYPWLLKDAPIKVRDLLYDAMEYQCKHEGTKIMRAFASEKYTTILDFFLSKNFKVKQEYLILEKKLTKNQFKIPENYKFRSLSPGDLPKLESISLHDPKVKSRFFTSDWSQFMNLSEYNPDDVIVAEKDNKVVGFYALTIPNDITKTKTYLAGIAVDPQHQIIEPYLIMELENRAYARGKKTVEIALIPDSKRLHFAQERGFVQSGTRFRLDKTIT